MTIFRGHLASFFIQNSYSIYKLVIIRNLQVSIIFCIVLYLCKRSLIYLFLQITLFGLVYFVLLNINLNADQIFRIGSCCYLISLVKLTNSSHTKSHICSLLLPTCSVSKWPIPKCSISYMHLGPIIIDSSAGQTHLVFWIW